MSLQGRLSAGLHSFGDDVLGPSGSDAVLWRSMGLLYVAAGAIALGAVMSGLDPAAHERPIIVLGVTAALCGLAVLAVADRIPSRLVIPALLLGIVLVSFATIASGEASSPFLFFYVWVGVEAWFFLRAAQAVALTVVTVVVSGAVIGGAHGADPDAGAWWLVTVGSLITVSALAAVLHGRAQRLIKRLAEAANHDELTRLLNRRGYQQRLEHELARARRYGAPLSIVLGDLDGFKHLNDVFGHRHGDQALREFADICRSHLRNPVDFVSRVGGEEFAIVLPDTPASGAILAAERIRRAVSDTLRTPAGSPVTASFGVATFPAHGTTAELLLDHADQAMYAAKGLGRNRTIAFGDNLPRVEQPSGQQEHLQAVVLLAETLDLRDAGTRAHSETVACLSQRIATALDLPSDRVELIRLSGLLHDVGKIGVPDDVLRKPGRLDPQEWAEMRKHPELGARIVEGAGLGDIAQWVLAHHERPDGNGYPYGLTAEEIPLEARILAITDAYEAMTADRPYRRAMPRHAAVAELERHAGAQFDAHLIEIFLTVVLAERLAAAA